MPGLKYPLQEEDKLLQSKIVFSIFEVDPPEFQNARGLITGVQNTWQNIVKAGSIIADVSNSNNAGLNTTEVVERTKRSPGRGVSGNQQDPSRETVAVSAMKITPVTNGQVSLYLPIAYQVNESLNYDTATALNASGAAAMAAMNAGSSALTAAGKGIASGLESITSFFDQGVGGIGARLAAERLARSPAGFLVPEGIRNAIGLTARVTVNPNIRTAFRGVNIREFSFQFKLLPKSAEESLEVKKIIRLLRRHAYPEEIRAGRDGASIPLGYKYPDLFKIRLLSGKEGEFKNVGTPIKMAQLRNISTVYNPTTTALHPDGSPTEIDLTLGFVEYKTISRDDIDNEDDDTFYDYYGKNTEFERFGPRDGYGGRSGGFEGAR